MLSEQIKKDRIQAKKDNEDFKYEVLTTLLSEVQRLEKPEQEDDDKVKKVIKKSVKGLNEMISVDVANAGKHKAEKALLEEYLPQQMTEDELEKAIDGIVSESFEPGTATPKDMGKVMKILKEKHDGTYDGKVASQVVRAVLNR